MPMPDNSFTKNLRSTISTQKQTAHTPQKDIVGCQRLRKALKPNRFVYADDGVVLAAPSWSRYTGRIY